MNRLLILLFVVAASCSPKKPKESSNETTAVAIELIGKINIGSIPKSDNYQIYQWNDHTVIFGKFDVDSISRALTKQFYPETVKVYRDPLYVFDKSQRCENPETASQWRHYLLTANLVEDPEMQQEYRHYHEVQFDEWPEVAQGFCNANFQQLLVYENNRQLLLVISIPADKTLNELNPLTTKDNPRMDEWNAMMGKYQEGIPGTGPDEVWVFLEEI
jgi:L-rhamnose mutarotase